MRVSYLKQRHNVYWFQRRPPTKLHETLGSKLITVNLQTADLATAIRKRDIILAEWTALGKTKGRTELYNERLEALKNEGDLSDSVGHVNEDLIDALSDTGVNTQKGAEIVLSQFSQAEQAAFWAWRNLTKGETPPSDFQYSIRDSLAQIIPHKQGTISQLHLDKYTVAVDLFMGKGEDCGLAGIRKSAVIKWLDTLEQGNSTKSTYLSCLGGIFEYAQDRDQINDQLVNPFKGIKLGKKDTKSYKMMPDETLRDILSHLKDHDHLPAILARRTGMRLSEVFNAELRIADNIHCLVIEETADYRGAKTEAGNRFVPVPLDLLDDVLEQQATWLNHSAYSKRFGKAKAKVIDCRQTTFHSLRVSFITHAQRAGYTEQNVAWLVGHEAGKGDAMTGQLYFKGYTLELMQEIIESVEPFTTTG
jgi:site-specific recombinase XerC